MLLKDQEIKKVRAPLEEGWTLPPVAYTRPEIFQQEVKTLFYREWICVAREEQLLASGDYRAVQVIDQPLIVVRQPDKSIRAMSAICPHRGMPVVESHGQAKHFSCPYHLWKFALDGALVSAPLMNEVADLPTDCGLAPVLVDTWQGFVFVNLDPEASSLSERLTHLNELVEGYDMTSMRIAGSVDYDCPWNWKLLIENFMEAYHHIGPHNDSLQGLYPARKSYVSGSVEDGWSMVHMPSVNEKAEEEERLLPDIPGLNKKQLSETLASVIMPSFCWLNTPAIAFWYELQPSSHDDMKLTIHAMAPKEMLDGDDAAEAGQFLLEVIKGIHEEDIPVNLGPWRGMHAPLAKQGRLSRLEESVWQLNQWWAHRVIDGR